MPGSRIELGEVVVAVDQNSAKFFSLGSTSPSVTIRVLDPQLSIEVVAASDGSVETASEVVLVGVDLGVAIVEDGERGPLPDAKALSQCLFLKEGIEEAAKPGMPCGVSAYSVEAAIGVVAEDMALR